MTEQSYQHVLEVLCNRIGDRWEGSEAAGHDEMVKILRSELGYDRRAANDTIDLLIKTGQLRYYHSVAEEEAPIVPGASGGGGGALPAGLPGAPAPLPAGYLPGYWQIGHEESGGVGRPAGQVSPKGLR